SGMVFAQVSTGDVTGRVLDPQGNAVVGATVTAKNNATGLTRTATTNDAAEDTLAQLPPGPYDFTVEAQGFSRALQKAFDVSVGTKPTFNFDFTTGGMTETVEVQGSAPVIETTKSEIGGVISP